MKIVHNRRSRVMPYSLFCNSPPGSNSLESQKIAFPERVTHVVLEANELPETY